MRDLKTIWADVQIDKWAADLSEMGSLSSKNKNVKYLLCIIRVSDKHAWVKPLNIKKAKQFLMVLSN